VSRTFSGVSAARSALIVAAVSAASTLVSASHAAASQGPGIAHGTAGVATQLAMAIVVYGISGTVIAMGLIGAIRRR
jgi:hypothetical protein